VFWVMGVCACFVFKSGMHLSLLSGECIVCSREERGSFVIQLVITCSLACTNAFNDMRLCEDCSKLHSLSGDVILGLSYVVRIF
jgi:hypothetical protein